MMVSGSSYEEWNYSSYMEQRDYLGNRTLKFQTLNQKKVKREKKSRLQVHLLEYSLLQQKKIFINIIKYLKY